MASEPQRRNPVWPRPFIAHTETEEASLRSVAAEAESLRQLAKDRAFRERLWSITLKAIGYATAVLVLAQSLKAIGLLGWLGLTP